MTRRRQLADAVGTHTQRPGLLVALTAACMLYVLWRPVSAPLILYPVLAILTACCVAQAMTHGRTMPGWLTLPCWLSLMAVLLGLVVGQVRNAPGVTQQAAVWVGSIVIWSAYANSFGRAEARIHLTVVMLGSAAVALSIILYVLANLGYLPAVLPESMVEGQGAGFDDSSGLSAIRWLGLSTLTAGTPLAISAAILGPDDLLPRRALTAPVALLTVVASLMAGRRAIVVVAVLTPILALILIRACRPRSPLRISPLLVMASPFVAGGVVLFGQGLLAPAGQVLSSTFGFLSSDTSRLRAGDAIRLEQSDRLLAAWADAPIIGNGLGSTLVGFVRSEERPWYFELQYQQLLMNLGLVGAVLIGAAVLIVALQIRRIAMANPASAPAMVSAAIAAVMLCIANASNPYLQAPGHGWALALAVGVALAVHREPDREQPSNENSVTSQPDRAPATSSLRAPARRR